MSQQFEKYLEDKNVQAFLGMLRDAEGTANKSDPYRTRFGGQVDQGLDLNSYPTFVKKEFTQTNGKKNLSSAVGAYQFLEKTWKGLVKNYGFEGFSPKTQDMAAIALLKENGALPFILRGEFDKALARAGKTWASLPSSPYPQHKRSKDFVNNSIAQHLGAQVDFAKYDPAPHDVKTTAPVNHHSTTSEPIKSSGYTWRTTLKFLKRLALVFRRKT